MSSHYTTRKLPSIKVYWRNLIVDLLTPLGMAAFAGALWSKGLPWLGVYALGIAWLYVLVRVWRISGVRLAVQIHALFSSLVFLAIGFWLFFTQDKSIEAPLYIIGGLVFMLAFVIMDLGERIKKLEAPVGTPATRTHTTGKRAEDFPGVYRITCNPNGMVYIGMSSRPIKERWAEHRHNLNGRHHHNNRWQHDWNIYRPEQFTWEVLEVVTEQAWLFDRERHWQDQDYATDKRYNPPNTPRIIHTQGKRPKR